MALVRALIAALILLIPWVKWEIFHRITVAELVFCALVAGLGIYFLQKKIRFSALISHRGFGLVVSLWLLAVLLSGVRAHHLANYFFEAGGMIYLGAVALAMVFVLALKAEWLDNGMRWLTCSIAVVGIICFVGIVKGFITGFGDLFFFSDRAKLIATFKYPNQLAGFLVLFLPVFWELLWATRGKKRFGYALMCFVVLGGVVASCSRAGIAVVGLLAVGYCVWSLARKRYKQVLTLVSLGATLIVAICLVALFFADFFKVTPVGKTVSSFLQGSAFQGGLTDSFRVENWSNAIRLFQQFPVTGYGVGNVWIDYGYEIHNTYLSALAEMGIIGGIALLALFGYVAFIAYQNTKIAARLRPTWTPYARGLFAGLVAYYIFATQHVIIRSRHLWLVFGLVVAMNTLLRKAGRTKGEGDVWNLRDTLS